MTKQQHQQAREIGSRIKAVRMDRNLSQEQLEAKAGISPTTVSHYEKGRRVPGTRTIMAICDALDVSSDWLLTGIDSAAAATDWEEMKGFDAKRAGWKISDCQIFLNAKWQNTRALFFTDGDSWLYRRLKKTM